MTDHPAKPSAARPVILAAQDVYKRFILEKKHVIDVLNGVNVRVHQGEWIALVGPSGCGKSTLLSLFGTLEKPTSGELFFRDRPYSQMSGSDKNLFRRREIGFVFQSFHLFPELNALENAALPGLQGGDDRRETEKCACDLLTQFGLGERLGHRPQELSGGEQQRVALARALINNPPILLADEPTGNLDAAAAAGIIDLLETLHREHGKTIVMVTHDNAIAARADRTIRLAGGRATES